MFSVQSPAAQMFSIFVRILLSTLIAPVTPVLIPASRAISAFGLTPTATTQKSASILAPFFVITPSKFSFPKISHINLEFIIFS